MSEKIALAAVASTAAITAASVTLDHPIKRGDVEIDTITIRKPVSGELRGLSVSSLLNLDYIALEKLLPRITTPRLTPQDVAALDPADLVQLGSEVMDFLLPKQKKQELSQTE